MNPTTATMLQTQEAPYDGRPTPQPRALTTILLMLMAQERQYSQPAPRPIPVLPPRTAKAELEAILGYQLDGPSRQGTPANIGEAAQRAGIDPNTATCQDWSEVLEYVIEQAQYHSLRSDPDQIQMVVDVKAKMYTVEGWAFDGWRKMRVGVTGRKGRQAIKNAMKPPDVGWQRFYQGQAATANAYMDLAEELSTILEA